MNDDDFRQIVFAYYDKHGRHDMPWREPELDGSFDPYKILVSELMLQQTQVSRVVSKYQEFLQAFPTIVDLADAPQGEVLRVWQGLGYNRRAKFLHQAAIRVVSDFEGHIPNTHNDLVSLPGIGPNTAGAILAYAYNQPELFIETNIRTVYIHHYFQDSTEVSDKELLPIIARTVDKEHTRQWYWALMDYGSYLKSTVGNLSRNSKHYTKQSQFDGSSRQVRGAIIRALTERSHTNSELDTLIADNRLTAILEQLVSEGLVQKQGDTYHL